MPWEYVRDWEKSRLLIHFDVGNGYWKSKAYDMQQFLEFAAGNSPPFGWKITRVAINPRVYAR